MKITLLILRFKNSNWKKIINEDLYDFFKLKVKKCNIKIHQGSIILKNIILFNKSSITIRFYFNNNEIVLYINNISSLMLIEKRMKELISDDFILGDSVFIQNINTSLVKSYDDLIKMYNIFLNSNNNTCIDTSQLSTGIFLHCNKKIEEISNFNNYSKIKLSLMRHLYLIYEKSKPYITYISNQLELTYKFNLYLSTYKLQDINSNIFYCKNTLLSINIENNLTDNEFVKSFDCTNHLKRKYKNKDTSINENENKFRKIEKKYYNIYNKNKSSDINRLILFQNYLELFKLLQIIKLISSPVCEILLKLLNHPITVGYENTILNTQLIKNFLKESCSSSILKSKKNKNIYKNIFDKELDTIKSLNIEKN